MTDILEAPIVHGRISVNNIASNVLSFSDGSKIDNIDTALNHNYVSLIRQYNKTEDA